MQSKAKKLNLLVTILFIGLLSNYFIAPTTIISQGKLAKNISIKDDDSSNLKRKNTDVEQSALSETDISDSLGYSTGYTSRFNMMENASSIITKRGFNATETNYFNISTPNAWNISSMEFQSIQTYHKNQTINNTKFDYQSDWSDTESYSGDGSINQDWNYNSESGNTESVYTQLQLTPLGDFDGFSQGDYGYWEQSLTNPNPETLDLQEGKLFQKRNESQEYFDDFDENNPGFEFKKDLANPYGGDSILEGSNADDVDLYTEGGSCVVNILPYPWISDTNPSAAWWFTIEVPYQADYAELSLSWEIDPDSTFEAIDLYEVNARVNNKAIDGRKASDGGDLIYYEDTIPLYGDEEALIIYNNRDYLDHGVITRTYDITELLDGYIGTVKIDFGAFAANPSKKGDNDRIIAMFPDIEIRYNTSNKYEVATLEFDYLSTYNEVIPIGDLTNNPETIVNRISLGMTIDKGSTWIRVLPFNEMVHFDSLDPSVHSQHVVFKFSQDYKAFLKPISRFAIGLYFEEDYELPIDSKIDFDNITFTLNLKHPSPKYSGLKYKINGTSETFVNNNYLDIDVSNWKGGQIRSFKFFSINNTFTNRLYLNFNSKQRINFTTPDLFGYAKYKIIKADSVYGVWNITYNNTFSLNKLITANLTELFNLSSYSIHYLNLPAFDSKGSKSDNWEIYNVIVPNSIPSTFNFNTYNLTSDKTNQSVEILQPKLKGNWTLQARQINYIQNCTFNYTSFRKVPIFYRDQIMQYNISIIEDKDSSINANYNITILDENGTIVSNSNPSYYTSSAKEIIGTLDLAKEEFQVGDYYIFVKWNDTDHVPGRTLRFGSILKPFRLINASSAKFNSEAGTVLPGQTANFEIHYETFAGHGIENASFLVYYNSSVGWRLWGTQWGDTSYKVGTPTYLGDGNYSLPVYTNQAPPGSYNLSFLIMSLGNQWQILFSTLNIQTVNAINATIIYGVNKDAQNEYYLKDWNIPYVNDTINSMISLKLVNLSDNSDPILGASIIGKIIDGYTFQAIEIGNGYYNLTIDTMGTNATDAGENDTLYISCSANNYSPTNLHVNISINKIPTQTDVSPVEPVYAEGKITLVASFENVVDESNPEPNTNGKLQYIIYNQSKIYTQGTLNHLVMGVYDVDISLASFDSGSYFISINSSANNCVNSSDVIPLEILPQNPTNMSISIPDPVRISNTFEIETKLTYTNSTPIANQQINLNITLVEENPTNYENFIVNTFTDSLGYSRYEYTISDRYFNGTIIINATYDGQQKIKASKVNTFSDIKGKKPVILTIIESPVNVRVGYSAKYKANVSIEDEKLNNLVILFTAYYEKEINNPFVSVQLYTNTEGECTYTIEEIANGYNNLTVNFIFLETSKVAGNITSLTDNISPKWSTTITIDPLPDIIRHGQEITFEVSFECSINDSISYEGLTVIFIFKYSIIEQYTEYISGDNKISLTYVIADDFEEDLNVSIHFLGNTKIASKISNFILEISDKVKVSIEFLAKLDSQYMSGTYFISVKVTDEDGNVLNNLVIIFELLDEKGNIVDSAKASTNEKGIASVSLDFSEVGDKFSIRIKFEEEGVYSSAELVSDDIRIVNEYILFMDILPYILLAIAIIAISTFALYKGVIIPRRERHLEALKQLYQKLSDVENLQYILILNKGGIPVFSKSLANIPIDESLISGFLSAISTFGEEIGSKIQDKKGGLEELSYRQFKVIIDEGKVARTALLLLKRPSQSLRAKLKLFNNTFEKMFYDEVFNFTGQVLEDIRVTPLIEQIFEADLLYPHQVFEQKMQEYIKTLSHKDLARKILIIAKGEEFEFNFYLRDMINYLKTKGIEEIKSFESLQKLKSDKIVFAINPRTNYLIEQLKPFINMLDADDKNVLFEVFDGHSDEMSIIKALKKKKISLSKDVLESLNKLKQMELLTDDNFLTDAGSALATLLKLIPDL
ncbi:MAG: hypothetical protein ACTSR8_20005 [Promethearchaeota archaeon]